MLKQSFYCDLGIVTNCYTNEFLLIVCTGALNDLNKAVELSEGKGRVASQALTQRAMIRRLRGNVLCHLLAEVIVPVS